MQATDFHTAVEPNIGNNVVYQVPWCLEAHPLIQRFQVWAPSPSAKPLLFMNHSISYIIIVYSTLALGEEESNVSKIRRSWQSPCYYYVKLNQYFAPYNCFDISSHESAVYCLWAVQHSVPSCWPAEENLSDLLYVCATRQDTKPKLEAN